MSARLCIALHAASVRRAGKWVLKDISLCLEAGERWALVGGNGAGKTQLLKLLGTDVWPDAGKGDTRIYRLGGRRVDVIAAKQRIAYIGAELQDKYARYGWNLEVGDLLATGLHRTDLLLRPVTADERRRVGAMLERCGLTPLRRRRFAALSYGEKRVALLARALLQEPDWLLLDELFNGLDAAYRRRIEDMLGEARAAGRSWIAAAHRAQDIPRGTRRLAELRAGRLLPVKRLRAADVARLKTQAREHRPRPRPPAAAGEVLLRICKASLYVEYQRVLQDLDWELRAGQHWAVFGANGAGKSSFLKLLYGDLSPALGGRIERTGFPNGTPIADWKRRVGYISPELQTDYAMNVPLLEVVASGRHASLGLVEPPTAAERASALRWLEFFSLRSYAQRPPRELSYGQLRRALFARALAGDARILLLDEPLTGLDPGQRAAMKRLLERLMKESVTLIIAVHHPEDLPNGMTHALQLHQTRAAAFDYHAETR